MASAAPPQGLDGHQFEGTLKARNTWLRVGVKGRILFQQGQFSCQALDEPQSGPQAAYQTQRVGNLLHFRVTVPAAATGLNQVQWQGTFDG
ncbi:hypothetical protein [Marinicella meishanensis]|uniref:hypothetical protein n=1 Tax=Marinicella meishanensis TaxID=2873263 RepID=UPI001CC13A88|nr:hypothetical protein [Marinicella sp. NBU2979]